MDDDEWWNANAPSLERLLEPGAFPVASRVGTAAATAHQGLGDPEHLLEFGLGRILDGVAALIATRPAGTGSEISAGDVEIAGPASTSPMTAQND